VQTHVTEVTRRRPSAGPSVFRLDHDSVLAVLTEADSFSQALVSSSINEEIPTPSLSYQNRPYITRK
jgi:hypothetical protein